MPELPEVETMCRGIAAAAGGRLARIVAEDCPRRPITLAPSLRQVNERVAGQTLVAIERAGKRVVLRFGSDERLVIEPRMTGLVLVADPPSHEHLRLRFELDDAPLRKFWYWDRRGLGVVRLLNSRQYAAQLGPDSLGPDALTIELDAFRTRLAKSRRPIKVALLDQQALAGVGNLYAAEVLHVARIQPTRPCHRLSRDQWQRLHQAIRAVLSEAIRYEGSTLSDGTYRNALNAPGGYQNHHRVYDREGETCPTCGSDTIRRIVQAQRSTFFCPTCQKAK